MSTESRLIPSSSQTVGPYFRIGLEYLTRASAVDSASAITIRGRVLDRDGVPVSDAMLEFWCPECESKPQGFPQGFRRVATDLDGVFAVTMAHPVRHQEGAGVAAYPPRRQFC